MVVVISGGVICLLVIIVVKKIRTRPNGMCILYLISHVHFLLHIYVI